MKRIFLFVLLLLSLLHFPSQISAADQWTEGTCVVDGVATIQGVECVLARVLNVAMYFVGIVVFVMLVFGAYKLLFSGGDPKAVEAGRNTITFAILGLVIAIAGWFILNFLNTFLFPEGDNTLLEFSTQL